MVLITPKLANEVSGIIEEIQYLKKKQKENSPPKIHIYSQPDVMIFPLISNHNNHNNQNNLIHYNNYNSSNNQIKNLGHENLRSPQHKRSPQHLRIEQSQEIILSSVSSSLSSSPIQNNHNNHNLYHNKEETIVDHSNLQPSFGNEDKLLEFNIPPIDGLKERHRSKNMKLMTILSHNSKSIMNGDVKSMLGNSNNVHMNKFSKLHQVESPNQINSMHLNTITKTNINTNMKQNRKVSNQPHFQYPSLNVSKKDWFGYSPSITAHEPIRKLPSPNKLIDKNFHEILLERKGSKSISPSKGQFFKYKSSNRMLKKKLSKETRNSNENKKIEKQKDSNQNQNSNINKDSSNNQIEENINQSNLNADIQEHNSNNTSFQENDIPVLEIVKDNESLSHHTTSITPVTQRSLLNVKSKKTSGNTSDRSKTIETVTNAPEEVSIREILKEKTEDESAVLHNSKDTYEEIHLFNPHLKSKEKKLAKVESLVRKIEVNIATAQPSNEDIEEELPIDYETLPDDVQLSKASSSKREKTHLSFNDFQVYCSAFPNGIKFFHTKVTDPRLKVHMEFVKALKKDKTGKLIFDGVELHNLYDSLYPENAERKSSILRTNDKYSQLLE